MASKQSTSHGPTEPNYKQICSWAETAIQSGGQEPERQRCLLLLLDTIANHERLAQDIALRARNVAWGAADFLIDRAIENTLRPLRKVRTA